MSEANNNNSPSRNGSGTDFDFGNLPDLPIDGTMHGGHTTTEFNLEDFFSTDMPMPSSPPKTFQLYEDTSAMANVNWSEFNKLNDEQSKDVEKDVAVKQEPEEDAEGLEEVDMVRSPS
ncbi:hypothetical protein B0O99DRAFT_681949 [Bisporella sp. PMI_857]|nr:hypothetical protein B0O99DRAFT_681949 [Bisporella sp. PMI_857]